MENEIIASFVSKHVGPRQIASLEFCEDFVSPDGTPVYMVSFEGGHKERLTLRALEVMATDNPIDHTAVLNKKLKPVVEEVLTILARYDIRMGEYQMFDKQLAHSIQNSINRAMNFRWKESDEAFIEGVDPGDAFTILEAHNILKKIPVKNEPKQEQAAAVTEGSGDSAAAGSGTPVAPTE